MNKDGDKINRCICTERQVRNSFMVLIFIFGIVIVTLSLYFAAMRYVKKWINEKITLKTLAKKLSKDTADKLNQVQNEMDPIVLNWFENLESYVVGKNEDGFIFLIDSNGKVWAHGKAKHLVRGSHSRVAGFYSVKQLDDEDETPISNIITASKRGGGYVHFIWKKGLLMISYVCPVVGTDLTLGTVIPVPKHQRIWEERNLMYRKNGISFAPSGKRRM